MPFDFLAQFLALSVGAYSALLMVRAIAARVAGNNAPLVLGGPLISINFPLPRRENENDQDDAGETGNTETANHTGNSVETPPETSDLMTVGYQGEQHLVPRMSREEYHRLLDVRFRAIGLLEHCVKYYKDNQAADTGVIPRYDSIGMNAKNRQDAVNDLWYSSFVVKSPNQTSVDPMYFTSCGALLQAIIDKRVRVVPFNYLEDKQKLLDEAVAALPHTKSGDDD